MPRPRAFTTTHWSLVLAAEDLSTPGAREALAELAEAYWYPLYAFARRRGHGAEEAADLVQGFFTRLLETSGLRAADRSRGRFRSYLLGAFKHFVSGQRQRESTLKRGGGASTLSLDTAAAEDRFLLEPTDERTPELVYERRWALAVIDRSLAQLRREWRAAGKETLFEELKGFLTDAGARGSIAAAAKRSGLSPGNARVTIHRLRRRFGHVLRSEIAATVADPEQVDEELRFLLDALGR